MSKTINEVNIRGKVADVTLARDGGNWQIHEVLIEGVPDAGQKKGEAGKVKIKTFKGSAYKVGQIVGVVARASGYEGEINDEGKVRSYFKLSLQADDKPHIIEDAPAAAASADTGSDW